MNTRLLSLTRIPFFLPLSSATLMLGVAMSFTAPYLSLFSVEQADMSPLKLGVFMTVIAASGVVASAFAGKWSDRHGHHRELLLAALIASSLGFLLMCVVRNYTALVVIGMLFLGAGGSAMSLVFSFARAALPVDDEAERSLALATLRTVLSMAWVFGPSVGALVLAGAGFYGLFLFAAACFVACGAIVWRMHGSPRGDPHSAPAHYAGDPTSLLEVTAPDTEELVPPHPGASHSRAEIWRATVAMTLIGLAASATMIVLPLYVVHGMHGTRIDVSIMLGLGAFLEIPMMLALGARASRLDKQRWLASCAVVHLIYFIAVAASPNVHFLIPMQAFNAFVVSVTSCLGMTYMQDLMPQSPGSATALFFNASRVGSILSGVLSGALVAALGYRGTFLVCGCIALSAAVLFANPPFALIARRILDWWKARRQTSA
ncbi:MULTISPECIES: sugar efflux transporter [Caballeronia]|uniref:MFS transporter n=1 Tax=Caballeronia zhejiangensis TaxID=871203 RepID=A0A656QQ05_9BURK|nr:MULTISPECIES: sugar efflux transporter [Caballeronia]EKS69901.1 major facilitator superfamily transporter [Burkholderia sp. SJ98]KDR32375.1 MFS transporter [Caballeronia zhejiangensis]MDR5791578.1 sugar efflux transporter [Caballeronia sp. LP003]